ncbi:hypothetical protein BKA82DRAFT_10483 [Pisolithus tinctorius]|uniref:Uncharacterized protein n=1 Tax=Pisolithus tinctorius Marx 270 TaxID=870435 RepID=A0A0C3JNA1_PISTI|nr:hypothetical protein BKA82DRAFT_10483 [Pisolithus tinctorius]KIN98986.1 hypothetical protein M404DRAFT_10483 [Pisolithus tinctorius Marx 270]
MPTQLCFMVPSSVALPLQGGSGFHHFEKGSGLAHDGGQSSAMGSGASLLLPVPGTSMVSVTKELGPAVPQSPMLQPFTVDSSDIIDALNSVEPNASVSTSKGKDWLYLGLHWLYLELDWLYLE